MTTKQTVISKDVENKKVVVVRAFDAPVEQVWKAWTESSLLDQWWAPKPWKAETKTMDFREGGFWLYAMVGPEGEKHWARVDFKTIEPQKSFTAIDAFCDENGKENPEFPTMHWRNDFHQTETGSKVTVEITYPGTADMEKMLAMGFEEGFTAALQNLDELLSK
jgi:uncharacterized protein YndB with AHSA1/START domain